MGKLTVFTTITPLPSQVPRQLALDMLHAHTEVIELNPLVTGVKPIEAPRDASSDEYFSSWYEISEIISWGLGFKKKLSFKGVFHDQPWGLQTHVYLPLGVDLRNKYRIGGNQPGEPREVRELGVETPLDGLYLRNDVEIICNAAMAGFIKKETKAAIGVMIDRMTRKAELLDEGKLHAMFENGRLKTSKHAAAADVNPNTDMVSPPTSPSPFQTSPAPFQPSPALQSSAVAPPSDQRTFGNYHTISRHSSQYVGSPNIQQHSPQQTYQHPAHAREPQGMHAVNELPGSNAYHPVQQPSQSFAAELPADSSYYPAPLQPRHHPSDVKAPSPQYHAYSPPLPQTQSNPFDRAAIDHQSQQQAPAFTQRESRASIASSAYTSSSTYSVPASVTTATSISASRPTSHDPTLELDHSRFSSLSIGGNGGGGSGGGGSGGSGGSNLPHKSAGTPPPQSLHSRSPPPPPPLAVQRLSAKCPVCGMFEGDEAAISHHVSKAHFS